MKLSQITSYPIKSCIGIDLQECPLDWRGLHLDREWMIVDQAGRAITQRSHPQLSQLAMSCDNGALRLSIENNLYLVNKDLSGTIMTVYCWDDACQAYVNNQVIDTALSSYLGLAVHLVRMEKSFHRQVVIPADVDTRVDASASFADGYPILIISEASLSDLNRRLDHALPMHRFRPNLVISGTEPFAEDRWKQIKIGETLIDLVKPCARCVFTCVDQESGKRGKEPLKTLASYRKFNNEIHFGMNAIHRDCGTLRLGDSVTVLR